MFTNQSILETNADPYPSLISVIGQVPYLEPGQLFFYLFAIIIFTFLLGLMNAANTAFENISDSNIFQLKNNNALSQPITLLKFKYILDEII